MSTSDEKKLDEEIEKIDKIISHFSPDNYGSVRALFEFIGTEAGIRACLMMYPNVGVAAICFSLAGAVALGLLAGGVIAYMMYQKRSECKSSPGNKGTLGAAFEDKKTCAAAGTLLTNISAGGAAYYNSSIHEQTLKSLDEARKAVIEAMKMCQKIQITLDKLIEGTIDKNFLKEELESMVRAAEELEKDDHQTEKNEEKKMKQ